jgi:hypothetical protein
MLPVTIHGLELYVRVFLGYTGGGLAPQAGTLQYVGLVH